MKKALILAAMAASAVSSQANATAACSGGTGGNYSFAVNSNTASQFVKTAFTVKCSANVLSNYSESGTALGVVSGSAKGKNYFGGGTGGGGIAPMGTCATSGCSTSEVSDTNSTTKMNAT